ncbi:MAG: hypothetical protein Q6352_009410 [Candidatus Freyrarchaeum guaymaensis]
MSTSTEAQTRMDVVSATFAYDYTLLIQNFGTDTWVWKPRLRAFSHPPY